MNIPAKTIRPLTLAVLLVSIAASRRADPALPLQNQEAPEIKSEETTPAFTVRAQRNEVQVRVVVRDGNSKAIGGLTRENFRLFDNGKPQNITAFRVENYNANPIGQPQPAGISGAKPSETAEAAPVLPQRYIAFYFDDLVVTFEDMIRTRTAAERYIESSMQPGDRAGVSTSSTLGNLDFTDDRAKLRQALENLRPHPRTRPPEKDCPALWPYEAYAIEELEDPIMTTLAVGEYIMCACRGDAVNCPDARFQAKSAARIAWQIDEEQSRQSLRVLENLVRRLSSLPGQRSILWISQGFLAITLQREADQLIDRALRERVVISALDAPGLWVDIPLGDASVHARLPLSWPPSRLATLAMYHRTAIRINDDVLGYIAHDTGGVFVKNTNDYDGGFRKAGLPQVAYLLVFSPQNLKYDGKFHKLEVKLANGKGLHIQARRGYFAPNQELRPEERAEQEIYDAVFAREEHLEFPVEVHTQVIKVSETQAQLAVAARIDAHALHFHKEGNRNRLSLKMVCVAFDRDGNLVDGTQQTGEFRLQDATLAHLLSTGLNMRGQLKVGTATYALRVVVYEVDSARMTALNRTVEIPHWK